MESTARLIRSYNKVLVFFSHNHHGVNVMPTKQAQRLLRLAYATLPHRERGKRLKHMRWIVGNFRKAREVA